MCLVSDPGNLLEGRFLRGWVRSNMGIDSATPAVGASVALFSCRFRAESNSLSSAREVRGNSVRAGTSPRPGFRVKWSEAEASNMHGGRLELIVYRCRSPKPDWEVLFTPPLPILPQMPESKGWMTRTLHKRPCCTAVGEAHAERLATPRA
ncbi:hypothetical protein ANO11243_060640 [Dothideomycetidae sp. 11243]|nr:hypothetical protein ANO11243_060640 [fungal sp. No.11243]